jgi:hypothetical protein
MRASFTGGLQDDESRGRMGRARLKKQWKKFYWAKEKVGFLAARKRCSSRTQARRFESQRGHR